MRRSFLFACALTFFSLIFCSFNLAQTGPTGMGSIMLSGRASFSSKGGDMYGGFDDDTQRIMSISGSGSADLFVLPYVALGAHGLLEMESYRNYREITWGLGPEALIFLGGSRGENAAGSIYPFLTAGFLYKQNISEVSVDWLDDSFHDEQSTNAMTTIKVGGGLCYMLTNTVGLIFEMNYEIDRAISDDIVDFEGNGRTVEGNNINMLAGISAFIH